MYKATTDGVTVTVMPVYIDERSEPELDRHFWAYRVIIENQSGRFLKLISRYWNITDSEGRTEEVRGEGVVGEQPMLNHGEQFTYTSGCPLNASSGIMVGSYQMESTDGQIVEIAIPAFPLDLPDFKPVIN